MKGRPQMNCFAERGVTDGGPLILIDNASEGSVLIELETGVAAEVSGRVEVGVDGADNVVERRVSAGREGEGAVDGVHSESDAERLRVEETRAGKQGLVLAFTYREKKAVKTGLQHNALRFGQYLHARTVPLVDLLSGPVEHDWLVVGSAETLLDARVELVEGQGREVERLGHAFVRDFDGHLGLEGVAHIGVGWRESSKW